MANNQGIDRKYIGTIYKTKTAAEIVATARKKQNANTKKAAKAAKNAAKAANGMTAKQLKNQLKGRLSHFKWCSV
jgi:hypothetical protein